MKNLFLTIITCFCFIFSHANEIKNDTLFDNEMIDNNNIDCYFLEVSMTLTINGCNFTLNANLDINWYEGTIEITGGSIVYGSGCEYPSGTIKVFTARGDVDEEGNVSGLIIKSSDSYTDGLLNHPDAIREIEAELTQQIQNSH